MGGRDATAEQGMALLITVMVLLLISAIGVAAINHAGAELSETGRTRATSVTFHGADAGIQLALGHLAQVPADLTPVNLNLGGGLNVQSRTRTETSPKPLTQVGLGPPPDGVELNVGSGVGSVSRLYVVDMTATLANAQVELQAKLNRLDVGGGGY